MQWQIDCCLKKQQSIKVFGKAENRVLAREGGWGTWSSHQHSISSNAVASTGVDSSGSRISVCIAPRF